MRANYVRLALVPALFLVFSVAAAACNDEQPSSVGELLLGAGDLAEEGVTVASISEAQSLDGPSALVELEGPGFRVMQNIIIYESREDALTVLDEIRADLVAGGQTGPGSVEASGVMDYTLGTEEAASMFLIEGRALVRLTATGEGRKERLLELAKAAREKLSGG